MDQFFKWIKSCFKSILNRLTAINNKIQIVFTNNENNFKQFFISVFFQNFQKPFDLKLKLN